MNKKSTDLFFSLYFCTNLFVHCTYISNIIMIIWMNKGMIIHFRIFSVRIKGLLISIYSCLFIFVEYYYCHIFSIQNSLEFIWICTSVQGPWTPRSRRSYRVKWVISFHFLEANFQGSIKINCSFSRLQYCIILDTR